MGDEASYPAAPVARLLHHLEILLGTGLYVGYIPLAPATFGSLIAIPFIALLAPQPWVYLITTLLLFSLGIGVARDLEGCWGTDAQKITIDEVSGMFVTFLFVPISIRSLAIGFGLFRLLDILKPPPVCWAERLPKGWGVMVDDLLAGVLTNLVLRALPL